MPRGKPKRGQFHFKLWLPGGGSFTFESMRDLTVEEWRDGALRYLEQARDLVEHASKQKAGTQ